MKWPAKWVCLLALAGSVAAFHAHRQSLRSHAHSASFAPSKPVQRKPGRASATVALALQKWRLSFEPAPSDRGGNRGVGVEFEGRASGMNVLLTRDGITLSSPRNHLDDDAQLGLRFGARGSPDARWASDRLTWEGKEKLRGTSNYFVGRDQTAWRTNVPHFASAQAKIRDAGMPRRAASLKVYGSDGGVEYDLRVPPGMDAGNLRLAVDGARGLQLGANGDLRMLAGTREVVMHAPVIYEEIQDAAPSTTVRKPRTGTRGPSTRKRKSGSPTARARSQQRSRARKRMRGGNARPPAMKKPRTGAPRRQHRPTRDATPAPTRFPRLRKPIDGAYVLEADGTIGFRVGPHDAGATVVIDPSISIAYVSFLGGAGSDAANSIAMDSSGNLYVGGTTTSASTFPEAAGTALGPGGGAADLFIAKIDPSQSGPNSLLYLTFLGGSGDETGGLVAVDSKGDVAVTGTTTSTDFPTTDQSQLTSGTNDAIVTQIDPTGSKLLYSTIFGGNGAEDAQSTGGIAFNSTGEIIVAGDTSSSNLKVSASAFQSTYGGGISDGFLVIFDPAATTALQYCTYLGIDAQVGVSGVAVDTSGDVYLSGFTTNPGSSFPAKNAFQSAYAGDPQDAFLMKISPKALGAAGLIYATLLGGSGMDEAYAVAVDSETPPNAYLTGTTQSADFPTSGTVAGYQTTLAPRATANSFLSVIAQNSTTGMTSLAYSSYIGGSETDSGNAIYVTAPNAVYIAGSTTSFNFPWHDNLEPFNGAADAFLAKMDPTSAGSASLIYSTPLGGISPPGGSASASAAGVVAGTNSAAAPQVYAAGQTTASGFPSGGGTGAGFQLICGSCMQSPPLPDAFVFAAAESSASMPSVYFVPFNDAPNVNFGTQPVGSTNVPPQSAAIYNGGEVPLQISSLEIEGPNRQDFSMINLGTCLSGEVQPGSFCMIALGFVPSIVGPEAATVVVSDNAPGNPQSLELIGTGGGPLVSLSPASLSFGNQPVGSTNPGIVVTLTNTGNQPLTLVNVTMAGAGNLEFPYSTPPPGCSSGATVGVGDSCVVNVGFSPTQQGAASAQLEFFDNSGGISDSEQVLAITGTGTAPGPVATLVPTALMFATQPVGSSSGAQIVTLTNKGSTGLNVSGISVTGSDPADFAVTEEGSSPCPIASGTVAIGQSCTVGVVYAPQAPGNQNANLSFSDDAPGSPQLVPLTGTGTQPTVQISPSTLQFTSQSVGTSSAAQTILVTNSGTSTLTIDGISLVGTDPGDFTEADNCNPGKSLPGGGNCQINVTFKPAATGSRSAVLDILDDAAGSPQSVPLSGTATQAGIQVQPASVNFGSQALQVASSPVTITASNNGTGALQFTSVNLTGTNAADFAISSDSCVGATVSVQPSANCTMAVTFTPVCSNSTAAISATLNLADNAPGSPQTVPLTGAATGNYCVTGATPQSVLAGLTATYSLNATAANGFVGNVALSVPSSACPAYSTCAVTPASVSVAGNASMPFTVQVVTTAGGSAGAYPVWIVIGGFLAFLLIASSSPSKRLRIGLASAGVAAALALALAACNASGGTGGGNSGTPAGPYQIMLVGTANGTSQSTTLNLTVTE